MTMKNLREYSVSTFTLFYCRCNLVAATLEIHIIIVVLWVNVMLRAFPIILWILVIDRLTKRVILSLQMVSCVVRSHRSNQIITSNIGHWSTNNACIIATSIPVYLSCNSYLSSSHITIIGPWKSRPVLLKERKSVGGWIIIMEWGISCLLCCWGKLLIVYLSDCLKCAFYFHFVIVVGKNFFNSFIKRKVVPALFT
jgi:hypothetical protein